MLLFSERLLQLRMEGCKWMGLENMEQAVSHMEEQSLYAGLLQLNTGMADGGNLEAPIASHGAQRFILHSHLTGPHQP